MATPIYEKQRLAENIYNAFRNEIYDKDSFDLAYDDFFEDDISPQQEDLRNEVFFLMQREHPSISKERIFKKAGGKDLRRDRQRTAKTVLTKKKEYIRRGAVKTDLKGYDTKQYKATPYKITAKVKNKVVIVRREVIRVKGNYVIRFRDRKGRFASVTRK